MAKSPTAKSRKNNKTAKGERFWRDPVDPTDEQFRKLCREFEIDSDVAIDLRRFLSDLVVWSTEFLADIRKRSGTSSVRKDLEGQSRRVERIVHHIPRLRQMEFGSTSGWQMLAPLGFDVFAQNMAIELSALISPEFLVPIARSRPPDRRKSRGMPDRRKSRGMMTNRAWVHSVIERHPVKVSEAALRQIGKAFNAAARDMKAATPKGGRTPYVIGPWILLNLAEAYARLGPDRKPSTDPNGPFGRFAHRVVSSMGLPSGWIDSQIRQAMDDWRKRRTAR